jgi:heavy metal sensor kinase
VVLLALTLAVFCGYLYIRLEQSLLAQFDAALAVAASQAPVQPGGEAPALRFAADAAVVEPLTAAGFGLRLLDGDGRVRDALGAASAPVTLPLVPGHATVETDAIRWRIYTRRLAASAGPPTGWLQVIQPLAPVQEALEGLSRQMLLGFPLALLLAAAGGLFLARRALAPVDRVTSTAAALSASDLSRRIGYRGPPDELGRLATTFDAMLDRLAAAFARERRFTADAAHELRTPLTALKGRIEVALSRPRSAEEHTATLRALADDVDRLARLSNDLLLLARLDDGELRPEHAPVRLDDLLESVVESVRDLVEVRGLTLHCQPMPALTVAGDLSQLSRLFLNLVDNALKFTPAGGAIRVSVASDGAWALITVADTGPGVAPEHLPLLGRRFYRGEADRARGAGGSGLGLAIAGEIARAHGGALTLASTSGQGTTATVRLPALDAATES